MYSPLDTSMHSMAGSAMPAATPRGHMPATAMPPSTQDVPYSMPQHAALSPTPCQTLPYPSLLPRHSLGSAANNSALHALPHPAAPPMHHSSPPPAPGQYHFTAQGATQLEPHTHSLAHPHLHSHLSQPHSSSTAHHAAGGYAAQSQGLGSTRASAPVPDTGAWLTPYGPQQRALAERHSFGAPAGYPHHAQYAAGFPSYSTTMAQASGPTMSVPLHPTTSNPYPSPFAMVDAKQDAGFSGSHAAAPPGMLRVSSMARMESDALLAGIPFLDPFPSDLGMPANPSPQPRPASVSQNTYASNPATAPGRTPSVVRPVAPYSSSMRMPEPVQIHLPPSTAASNPRAASVSGVAPRAPAAPTAPSTTVDAAHVVPAGSYVPEPFRHRQASATAAGQAAQAHIGTPSTTGQPGQISQPVPAVRDTTKALPTRASVEQAGAIHAAQVSEGQTAAGSLQGLANHAVGPPTDALTLPLPAASQQDLAAAQGMRPSLLGPDAEPWQGQRQDAAGGTVSGLTRGVAIQQEQCTGTTVSCDEAPADAPGADLSGAAIQPAAGSVDHDPSTSQGATPAVTLPGTASTQGTVELPGAVGAAYSNPQLKRGRDTHADGEVMQQAPAAKASRPGLQERLPGNSHSSTGSDASVLHPNGTAGVGGTDSIKQEGSPKLSGRESAQQVLNSQVGLFKDLGSSSPAQDEGYDNTEDKGLGEIVQSDTLSERPSHIAAASFISPTNSSLKAEPSYPQNPTCSIDATAGTMSDAQPAAAVSHITPASHITPLKRPLEENLAQAPAGPEDVAMADPSTEQQPQSTKRQVVDHTTYTLPQGLHLQLSETREGEYRNGEVQYKLGAASHGKGVLPSVVGVQDTAHLQNGKRPSFTSTEAGHAGVGQIHGVGAVSPAAAAAARAAAAVAAAATQGGAAMGSPKTGHPPMQGREAAAAGQSTTEHPTVTTPPRRPPSPPALSARMRAAVTGLDQARLQAQKAAARALSSRGGAPSIAAKHEIPGEVFDAAVNTPSFIAAAPTQDAADSAMGDPAPVVVTVTPGQGPGTTSVGHIRQEAGGPSSGTSAQHANARHVVGANGDVARTAAVGLHVMANAQGHKQAFPAHQQGTASILAAGQADTGMPPVAASAAACKVEPDSLVPGQGAAGQGPMLESDTDDDDDPDADELDPMQVWKDNIKVLKAAKVPIPPHMLNPPPPVAPGTKPRTPPTARDLTAHLPADQRNAAIASIRREKNRLAARKCRAKKVVTMEQTERRFKALQAANADLKGQLGQLRSLVTQEVQRKQVLKAVFHARWLSDSTAASRLLACLPPRMATSCDAQEVLDAVEDGTLQVAELVQRLQQAAPTLIDASPSPSRPAGNRGPGQAGKLAHGSSSLKAGSAAKGGGERHKASGAVASIPATAAARQSPAAATIPARDLHWEGDTINNSRNALLRHAQQQRHKRQAHEGVKQEPMDVAVPVGRVMPQLQAHVSHNTANPGTQHQVHQATVAPHMPVPVPTLPLHNTQQPVSGQLLQHVGDARSNGMLAAPGAAKGDDSGVVTAGKQAYSSISGHQELHRHSPSGGLANAAGTAQAGHVSPHVAVLPAHPPAVAAQNGPLGTTAAMSGVTSDQAASARASAARGHMGMAVKAPRLLPALASAAAAAAAADGHAAASPAAVDDATTAPTTVHAPTLTVAPLDLGEPSTLIPAAQGSLQHVWSGFLDVSISPAPAAPAPTPAATTAPSLPSTSLLRLPTDPSPDADLQTSKGLFQVVSSSRLARLSSLQRTSSVTALRNSLPMGRLDSLDLLLCSVGMQSPNREDWTALPSSSPALTTTGLGASSPALPSAPAAALLPPFHMPSGAADHTTQHASHAALLPAAPAAHRLARSTTAYQTGSSSHAAANGSLPASEAYGHAGLPSSTRLSTQTLQHVAPGSLPLPQPEMLHHHQTHMQLPPQHSQHVHYPSQTAAASYGYAHNSHLPVPNAHDAQYMQSGMHAAHNPGYFSHSRLERSCQPLPMPMPADELRPSANIMDEVMAARGYPYPAWSHMHGVNGQHVSVGGGVSAAAAAQAAAAEAMEAANRASAAATQRGIPHWLGY